MSIFGWPQNTVVLFVIFGVVLVATMFSMGLGLSMREIAPPLHHPRLIGIALLINLVIVPLPGIAAIWLILMEMGVAAGLLIVACSPGSTIGPKLVEFSRGDVSLQSVSCSF